MYLSGWRNAAGISDTRRSNNNNNNNNMIGLFFDCVGQEIALYGVLFATVFLSRRKFNSFYPPR
jgi:hypothetical protein